MARRPGLCEQPQPPADPLETAPSVRKIIIRTGTMEFEIDSFDIVGQYYDRGRPTFRGLFEDNDPTKRLMVMVNFNTDISNYWEFSAEGFKPIDESNQAYKLGVNYIIYGMTH